MSKTLKTKIVALRSIGYSYNQISEELDCAKSTVCYYCGQDQNEKKNNRQRKHRLSSTLMNKVEGFCYRKKNDDQHCNDWRESRTIQKILSIKLRGFSMNRKTKKCKQLFTVKDLIKKIGDNPVCYLTGRPINLEDGRSYHLDHIVSVSNGGDNTLDNCNIACRDANQAKSGLSKEEFIQLCKEVVNYCN